MARNRDKTFAKARRVQIRDVDPTRKIAPKRVRVIQVLPIRVEDDSPAGRVGDYYYRVRAGGSDGEILYHSQPYVNKTVAKNAGIREHEGRSKFEYIIEWTDGRSGALKRETL